MDDLTAKEFEIVHAEDKRQNQRIDKLEENLINIQAISLSVERLAINMEHILEEIKEQGNRLTKLENEPAEAWNKTKNTIITAIVSGIATLLLSGLIHSVVQNMTM